MDSEDLYPNDSSYWLPSEPREQKIARKKEQAKTLEAVNVLKEIVKRLDERIEYFGTVDAIPDEVKYDPTAFLNMHNANQMVRNCLRSEKEYIESIIDAHKR